MSIEGLAKSWLIDPLWQKVFKHTVDVLEDYFSYLLVAIGAVCLSVRLLTTLGTGDVVCMILAVEHQNLSVADLGPYVSGGTLGLINYANTDANCINSVFSKFLEYLPYIMLGQTLLLIITEKFTFRIPRIAQRVERFYKNIVEESLFGKDPDVAEDMYNAATSTDAIGRMRQRNEICVVLKRSSIIHHAYIGKNVCEILEVLLFLPLNIYYGSEDFDKEGTCHININPINGVYGNSIINATGHVHFQCQGKKMSFFMLALWAQIILLGLHMICSIIAIFWCLYFRSVTNLLNTIEAEKGDSSSSLGRLKDAPGEDFLFLFDLLAHSCGLESTLRVLTHSDDTFYEICKPEFDLTNGLNLEEDKLQVFFGPCAIERWLQGGKKHSSRNSHKHIGIDNYEVTIYPAESSRHTQTIPSSLADLEGHAVVMSGDQNSLYNTWFYDLNGGKTEYVITISVVIGKSRMKGEKVVTPLLPYGAEKPRSGMVKAAQPDAVEIFWDPPKGDFTKYVLIVDKLSESVTIKAGTGSLLRLPSNTSSSKNLINAIEEVDEENDDQNEMLKPMSATRRELSSKLNDYKVVGLDPGEAYKIKLGTKTGMVDTRQPIEDIIMTKPKAPKGLRVSDVDSSSCKIHWLHPEKHHSCLKSYQIKIRSSDKKFSHDVTPLRHVKTWPIRHGMLQQAQDYDITVTTLCVRDQITTESEESKISFTTLPESIKNLKLESSTPNSLTVKWDIPIVTNGIKYVLAINANTSEDDEADDDDEEEITKIKDFEVKNIEVSADKSQYTFNDLPKIIGTGHAYDISVVTVYTSPREIESKSKECKDRFMTRPLPPTKLAVGDKDKPLQITWHKSVTPNVVGYKVRWKPMNVEDADKTNVKTDEATISDVDPEQDQIFFSFPPGRVQAAQVYKVNVYAFAESANLSSESKELHEKFLVQNESEIIVYVENE